MSFALNEVEATAKKASRGAGYSWGLAEEAGKATRWLCGQGLDGVAILATALSRPDQTLACPLTRGAQLSDRAATLAEHVITLRHVAQPALLLAFAAQVARQTGYCITVDCGVAKGVTDGTRLSLTDAFPPEADLVRVYLGGRLAEALALASRARPDEAAWAELNRLAHRTYAPATEESRLLGAGAGLSDND